MKIEYVNKSPSATTQRDCFYFDMFLALSHPIAYFFRLPLREASFLKCLTKRMNRGIMDIIDMPKSFASALYENPLKT